MIATCEAMSGTVRPHSTYLTLLVNDNHLSTSQRTFTFHATKQVSQANVALWDEIGFFPAFIASAASKSFGEGHKQTNTNFPHVKWYQ